MYPKLKQEMRLSQQLVMTPQLQMAIKLLQLSRLELTEVVKEELKENPVLEEVVDAGEKDGAEADGKSAEEVDWQSYLEEYAGRSFDRTYSARDDEGDTPRETILAKEITLQEQLMSQLRLSGLTKRDMDIGTFVIGNIDDDGYLRVVDNSRDGVGQLRERTLEEIAAYTGSSKGDVQRVLKKIHQFNPIGAGAMDLKECLLIQARLLPVRDALLEAIITDHLGDLEKNRYKLVASALAVPFEAVVRAIKSMNTLKPRPGMGYGTESSYMIVPDAYIFKVDGEYVIDLNEDGLPKLRISPYYRRLMVDGCDETDGAKTFVREKMRRATWLIKSIYQRQRTIYKVLQSIVNFQKDFLDRGVECLRPMGLKDVADDIGMHESTVSRVTSNKYVNIPGGVFEIKSFFSTSINKVDGTDVSADSIKEKIRGIIASEDGRRPLSDQRIVEMLRDEGIMMARRTVAKYREGMGILSSSRRKKYF